MKRKIAMSVMFALLTFGQAGASDFGVIPYDLANFPISIYKTVDRSPVGDTSPDMYIAKWKLPKSIEKYFLARANGDPSVESSKAYITKKDNKKVESDGKHFYEYIFMAYGKKGKSLPHVLVKFGIIRDAIYWSKDFNGVRYYLVRDNICSNWALHCERAPEPKAQVDISEATVLPKGKGSDLIPMVEEVNVVEEDSSWLPDLNPDWDSWVGTGVEFGLNSDDFGYYYTGFISLFPHIVTIGEADVYLGPSWQHTGWAGSTGNVTYDGYFDLFGADMRYKLNDKEYQLKVYYGKKHGSVDGDGFPYHASSEVDLLALEGAYLWWYETGQDEIGFRFEFDMGGSKFSTWEGNQIFDDPRDDETMLMIRYKRTWFAQEGDWIPYTKTAQGSIAHVEADKSIRLGADLGLKLYNENIEPTVGLRYNTRNDKFNGVAAIQIHASDIIKDFWTLVTSESVKAEE